MEQTEQIERRFSIGKKMYIFVVAIVLFAAVCVCANSFFISVDQINTYYKRLTLSNAKNYATLVDVEFLSELRVVAESEEFQSLRNEAEEAEDESLIQDYLIEKGLWDRYQTEREKMRTYVNNMEDLEYLYVIAWGPKDAERDMYLLDADDVPFYQTGYYELREAEFAGVEPSRIIDPVISHGDWGWLCSAYCAVYDEEGNYICHVGCDVNMEVVMEERYSNLAAMVVSSLVVTIFGLAVAFVVVNRTVVRPLKEITADIKKFSPSAGKDYIASGVTNIPVKKEDEIGDIYTAIQQMQRRIVDYINDITTIRHDKEKADADIKMKEKEIGEISKEAFKDGLTGVGNKNAYLRKVDELNMAIGQGKARFAVVMMDVNRLKIINDKFGHDAGDAYLKGSCHAICDVLKHSPVFRIGGDEFVALLTGEDFREREDRVKTLRELFDKTYRDETKQPWERYSVSVGISDFQAGDENVDAVFKRADKLMYEEKEIFKKNSPPEE